MLEPTPKLMNILYACAHSKLPWGQAWTDHLPLCDGLQDDETGAEYEGYVLCCGHTINAQTESPSIIGAGLMLPGRPDKFGRKTLTITNAGRKYLLQHMDMVEFH